MNAAARIQAWKADPVLFVRDNFKVEPDAWQADTLALLGAPSRPRRRIGMKACTGPGKSALLAWAGWHRLVCFAEKGEHPKGYALSVTADNLKDTLWAELSKWQTRSPFLTEAFAWTKERIFARDHPETWFLSARAFAKDADAEAIGRTLSGLHSKFPFILLDETGEMPISVARAADQIFTGDLIDGAVLAAGNPTSTDGLLYHICSTARSGWDIITITADPDDPKRTPRVDIEHAREMIRLYGKDNPWVMATILGQFPPGGFNALLSVEEVEAAMARSIQPVDYEWSQKRLGVDVAQMGDDRTVIFPRQGLMVFKPVEMRNQRGPAVAARVAAAKAKWGSEMELVDATGGYGAAVVDAMVPAGLAPVEVQFGGKANDPRYFNKRSEMWFQMAEFVKKGGCLPKVPELVRELTAPTYSYQGGKFRLEEKDQIKKRLGFSPDLADALACTFAIPDAPGAAAPAGLAPERVAWDYDPFKES